MDAQVYTTLFKALKEGGRLDLVLSFLEAMKEQNITPTRPTYNVLFSFLGQEGRVGDALRLFEEMKEELGLEATPYDYGTLISACGKALGRCQGQEEEVETLVRQAEVLLKEAEESGAFAARGTGKDGGLGNCCLQMLKVYGKAGRWEAARDLLLDGMPRVGFVEPSFAHVYEAMRACAHAGQADAALALLQQAKEKRVGGRNVHILCWNAAVLACQRTGRWEACLGLLKEMQAQGQDPGHINYARTIQVCGDAGKIEEAWGLYQQLLGQQPGRAALDHAVYGSVVLACGQARQPERVQQVLQDMGGMGAPDGLNVAQAVAALALDGGQIEAAQALLKAGPSSLLAFHVLLLAVLRGEEAGRRTTTCQALVDDMMEAHGLCPTSLTKALLQQAGCDVSGLFVDGGAEEDTTVEGAETRLRALLRLNPHDALKRRALCDGVEGWWKRG